MPINLDGMVIPIGVDSKTADGIAKVKQSLQELSNSAQSFGETLRTGLEALGLDLTINAFKEMVQSTVEATAAFEALAQKTGISTKELSALTFAAGQSSVSADALQTGLRLLSKNMVDASNGVTLSKDAFNALGVSTVDASGNLRPLNSVLLDVAQKFSQSEDGAGKARVALQLFGRSGTDLIPLLNQGRDGIDALTKKAAELGITIDDKTAKQMDDFANRVKVISAETDAAKREFVSALIPALEQVSASFGSGQGKMDAFKTAGEALGTLVKGIAAGFYTMAFSVDYVFLKLQKYSGVLAGIANQNPAQIAAGMLAAKGDNSTADALVEQYRKQLLALFSDPASQGGGSTKPTPTGSINLVNSAELEKQAQAMQKLLSAIAESNPSDSLDSINAKYEKMVNEVLDLMGKFPALRDKGVEALDSIDFAWRDAIDKMKLKNQEFYDSFSNKVLASMLSVPVEGVRSMQEFGRQIEVTFKSIAAQEKAVTDQAKNFGVSQKTVEVELAPLRQKQIKDLQQIVDYYKALAQYSKDPTLIEQAQKFQAQLDQLKATTVTLSGVILNDVKQGWVGAFKDVVTQTTSVSGAFKNMALSIIKDIENIITEMLAMRIFMGIFGAFFPAPSVASVNSAGLGSLSSLNVPFGNISPIAPHAAGGSFSAGQAMLVGEMGPELILPNTSGTVVPNSKLGGNTYNIDARGSSPGVEQSIMKAIKASEDRAVVRSVRSIDSRAKRRG